MKITTKACILIVIIGFIIFTGCKKSNSTTTTTNNNNPGGGGGTGITSSLYFQASIAGQTVTFEEGKNGYGCGAGAGGGTTSGGYEEEQSINLLDGTGNNSSSVMLMKSFPSAPDSAQIQGMFSIKSYGYGKREYVVGTAVDGAIVEYFDGTGKSWSSDKGTANQSGSTFSITEHIVNTDGFSYRISKASFKCTLYDGNGNSKTLTSGICRGRSVQIQ